MAIDDEFNLISQLPKHFHFFAMTNGAGFIVIVGCRGDRIKESCRLVQAGLIFIGKTDFSTFPLYFPTSDWAAR